MRRKLVLIGMRAADPLDLVLLDRAQQLRLQVHAQVADLVEEERAARRQLELADLLADGAGERSLFVAEERALDQFSRDRRQVHRDERRAGIARLAMQQPREQFLAGAALAEDEHRGWQLGDLLHQLDHFARGTAGPDDELAIVLLGHLGVQPQDAAAQVLALAGIGHEQPHGVGLEVLGHVVERAVAHRLDGDAQLLHFGDHHDLDVRIVLLGDVQDVEPADARKVEVEEHHVHVLALHQFDGRLARRGAQHPVIAPQRGHQGFACSLVLVDDENGLPQLGHLGCASIARPPGPGAPGPRFPACWGGWWAGHQTLRKEAFVGTLRVLKAGLLPVNVERSPPENLLVQGIRRRGHRRWDRRLRRRDQGGAAWSARGRRGASAGAGRHVPALGLHSDQGAARARARIQGDQRRQRVGRDAALRRAGNGHGPGPDPQGQDRGRPGQGRRVSVQEEQGGLDQGQRAARRRGARDRHERGRRRGPRGTGDHRCHGLDAAHHPRCDHRPYPHHHERRRHFAARRAGIAGHPGQRCGGRRVRVDLPALRQSGHPGRAVAAPGAERGRGHLRRAGEVVQEAGHRGAHRREGHRRRRG